MIYLYKRNIFVITHDVIMVVKLFDEGKCACNVRDVINLYLF